MVSIPNFWLAIVLQLVLAFTLTILPFTGRFDRLETPPLTITGLYTLNSLLTLNFAAYGTALRYLIAPAFCLSLGALATSPALSAPTCSMCSARTTYALRAPSASPPPR